MMPPAQAQYIASLQAQQQQQGVDPLQAGSSAALQSAMQSRQMSDDQRRRALGMAVMEFSKNHSPGNNQGGWQGALQNVAQSLTPAVETYLREQQLNEAQNLEQQKMLMDMYRREREHQFDVQKHKDLQTYRNKSLDATLGRGSSRGTNVELQTQKHLASLNKQETDIKNKIMREVDTLTKQLPPQVALDPKGKEAAVKRIQQDVFKKYDANLLEIYRLRSQYVKQKEKPKTFNDHESEIDAHLADLRGNSEVEEGTEVPEIAKPQSTPSPFENLTTEQLEQMRALYNGE